MREVTKRVVQEILEDPFVKRCQIEVFCSEEGCIILEGVVSSYFLKQMAQTAALRVVQNTSEKGNGCPYLALSLDNQLKVTEKNCTPKPNGKLIAVGRSERCIPQNPKEE
jgi:hypothetical protein